MSECRNGPRDRQLRFLLYPHLDVSTLSRWGGQNSSPLNVHALIPGTCEYLSSRVKAEFRWPLERDCGRDGPTAQIRLSDLVCRKYPTRNGDIESTAMRAAGPVPNPL